MFDLDDLELGDALQKAISSRLDLLVGSLFEDVNANVVRGAGDAEKSAGAAAREYSTTPGSLRQSFGPWHQAVANTLVDDLRHYRQDPMDTVLAARLMASTKLYQMAGSLFAEIIVHANAVAGDDALGRPSMDEKRRKHSRVLRAEHLTPAMQGAVLDAVSNDTACIERAKNTLKMIIMSDSDADIQLAAALLGQINDPFNRSKLNNLAAGIEKAAWVAAQSPPPCGKQDPVSPRPNDGVDARPSALPSQPTSNAEIVDRGGETARRLGDDGRNETPHRRASFDKISGGDAAAFYGEDSE